MRIPLIAGFNDGTEPIARVVAWMQRLGLFEVNLLPFHRLGESKWAQLGQEYAYREQTGSLQDKLLLIQDMFLSEGIACYIGADTPF